jgi:hypothetical protein
MYAEIGAIPLNQNFENYLKTPYLNGVEASGVEITKCFNHSDFYLKHKSIKTSEYRICIFIFFNISINLMHSESYFYNMRFYQKNIGYACVVPIFN